MKVTLKGKQLNEEKLIKNIYEVVAGTAEKIGIPKGTLFQLEDVNFKVAFALDGKALYATVPREINGKTFNEMLEIVAEIDENGEVKDIQNNEEKSFVDGYSLAKAVGEDYEYEGIESAYGDEELVQVDEFGDDEVRAVKYELKDDPDYQVVRHYKVIDGVDTLIAEYKLIKPEDKKQEGK